MVDHLKIAGELPKPARQILLHIHSYHSENEVPPTRREIMAAVGILGHTKLTRNLDHLLSNRLIEKRIPKAARNLRITPLGRGVIAELTRPQQASLPL